MNETTIKINEDLENSENEELEDNQEMKNRIQSDLDERNWFERNMSVSRYNTLVLVAQAFFPIVFMIGLAVGLFFWIKSESFQYFLTVHFFVCLTFYLFLEFPLCH